MPDSGRMSLGEALITTALLSLYLGNSGTALAIAAAQTGPSLCASAAASGRRAHDLPRARAAPPPKDVTDID
jgi:hypothetical protein